MVKSSDLEAAFRTYWFCLGGMSYQTEYRFHSTRKWRFDIAFPCEKVAIELEGGVWSGGRHTRPRGFENDVEKYNSATLNGWRVFRITAKQLESDPSSALLPIMDFINAQSEKAEEEI